MAVTSPRKTEALLCQCGHKARYLMRIKCVFTKAKPTSGDVDHLQSENLATSSRSECHHELDASGSRTRSIMTL